jgi:NAD-dependent DNA ligase
VGEEAGSKAARAVALKRPVLNEQELQALLDNPDSAGGGEAGD